MNFKYPAYSGSDLGMCYTSNYTSFRLWAPSAESVILRIYPDGDKSKALARFSMQKSCDGTWITDIEGDQEGRYYTYQVYCAGRKLQETADPYAVAVGVNGKRSMILDLRRTDPEGFDKDHGPVVKNRTDIIVTELSVADATGDEGCNAEHPGLFLGLTEEGLRTDRGNLCGLDYLADLGITHVQLMPFYDFATVDEAACEDKKQYNWGYDPLHYNVPEGSYSTDPFHGEVRIRECKEMIAAFHRKGIGVIMDVVYNHVYQVGRSPFERTVPQYYFRHYKGALSNGSGCGNEIASENPMVRKYIIDSLLYWVKEYHIDGFRFDLMGVLDLETLRQAREALQAVKPDIILYGEGWAGGLCAYPEEHRCVKTNMRKLQGVGAFSDDIRDLVKGCVFSQEDKGFATGKKGQEANIRYCVTGGLQHPQLDNGLYDKIWTNSPEQVVNYLSCHDNLTLWDKLFVSCFEMNAEERLRRNCLAASILFTSQGFPLFLAGEEFARSKPLAKGSGFSENSYNQPLSVNSLKYDRQEDYKRLHDYYKGLIRFRKAHNGLRFSSAEEVRNNITFLDNLPEQAVGFVIRTPEEKILVVYNAANKPMYINFLQGEVWGVSVYGTVAGSSIIAEVSGHARVEACSTFAAVLMKE